MDHPQLSSIVLKSPLGLAPAFQVNLNAAPQGSSPLLSPVLSDAGGARVEEDDEMKRKVRSQSWGMLVPCGSCAGQCSCQVRSCACWVPNADCVVSCGGRGKTPVLKLDVLCCCGRVPTALLASSCVFLAWPLGPPPFVLVGAMCQGTVFKIHLLYLRMEVSSGWILGKGSLPPEADPWNRFPRVVITTPSLRKIREYLDDGPSHMVYFQVDLLGMGSWTQ